LFVDISLCFCYTYVYIAHFDIGFVLQKTRLFVEKSLHTQSGCTGEEKAERESRGTGQQVIPGLWPVVG
jgi:hypothetical protein